ncbi:MAG: Crp/Fnr family transcriptional regulator [Xanthobacteraceae bacterium]
MSLGPTFAGRVPPPEGEDARLLREAQRLISACVLFRGLGELQRAKLSTRTRVRHYAAGETIFLMGDAGATLMAVVAGSVQISVPSPDGKEILLAIMQPGEIFGEIGLLDGKERSADARAMGACSLAVLDRKDVLSLFEECPSAYSDVVMLLCDRIRRTTTQMAEVTLLDLPVRLAKALLRAAAAEGAASAGPGHTNDRVILSQRALGKIVGATRESVNKCLRNWQRAGLVEVANGGIRITDLAALQALADVFSD